MEHSKTPWRIEPATKKDNWRIVASNGQVVSTFSGNMDMDNARRIVACINACSHIPTDRLEMAMPGQMKSSLDGLCDSVERLTAQRDELLTVLEGLLDEVAGCMCTHEMPARAFIQKVRGGE